MIDKITQPHSYPNIGDKITGIPVGRVYYGAEIKPGIGGRRAKHMRKNPIKVNKRELRRNGFCMTF